MSCLSRTIRRATAAVAVATLVAVVVGAPPASAAGAAYGTWTVAGANPSWNGTMTVPATGFPAATYTTNSNTPQIPAGNNAFLGPATPFGAVFGSSQGVPYLSLGTAARLLPSTTTFTFPVPTPATGWGFALGDIDADQVQVSATGPDGPLSADELGYQSSFNYCAASPPPSCTRPQFTDQPTWNAASSTLVGNVADTDGASGWFRPTKPITSLTFTFSILSGFPSYQIWFAALTRDISGTVILETDGGPMPPPPGTTLVLQHEDGSPVLDDAGQPVVATPGPDGAYSFDEVGAATYQVVVQPPPGYETVGPGTLPADATGGDVTDLDFVLRVPPPIPPTTTTTTTTVPPPSTTEVPAPPGPPATHGAPPPVPRLPVTGGSSGQLAGLGLALLALGAGVVHLARRLSTLR